MNFLMNQTKNATNSFNLPQTEPMTSIPVKEKKALIFIYLFCLFV